jgi:Rieske 2Fe-2S family protein
MTIATKPFRLQSEEYTGPPKEWFLDPAWFDRDLEAVFRPSWLVAGHVDELDSRGAEAGHGFITFAIGDDEVFIRRDEEGEVRGYYNVCPHRGAKLCDGASGRMASKRIVCPYHAWTFSGSDGGLISARHMHADFDREAVSLTPVETEVWNGLIFVRFGGGQGGAVADFLGRVAVGGYDLSAMKLAARKTHEIAANWKIVVENNSECYHCVVIHPELSAVYDWRENETTDFEGAIAAGAAGLDVLEANVDAPETIEGRAVCALRAPRIDEDPDPHSSHVKWEPGVVLIIARDHGWLFVPRPVAPDRTELSQYWFVAKDAEEGRDYQVDELMSFWNVTMAQDLEIVESIQRGMRMSVYRPGPLNRLHQAGQAKFFAWYVEAIREYFPELVEEPTPDTAAIGERAAGYVGLGSSRPRR